MGYIYEAMDRAKECIEKSFNFKEEKYKEIFDIIDKRWEVQLHRPLHAAGHILNPEFFYDNPQIELNKEVMGGFIDSVERLVPDLSTQDLIITELSVYTKSEGLFARPVAIRQRKTRSQGNIQSLESKTYFYQAVKRVIFTN